MNSDKKKFCADLILSDAIQDLAEKESITISEARTKIIRSKAFKALYDYETNLWQEGPDYLLSYYLEELR